MVWLLVKFFNLFCILVLVNETSYENLYDRKGEIFQGIDSHIMALRLDEADLGQNIWPINLQGINNKKLQEYSISPWTHV